MKSFRFYLGLNSSVWALKEPLFPLTILQTLFPVVI